MKNKVGRPIKYTSNNIRLEVRRQQNRVNQQKSRLKKKTLKEIIYHKTTKNQLNSEYTKNIIEHFSKFEYNYFFTGTFDPSKEVRNERIKRNKGINDINNEYFTNFLFEHEEKISIQSLRKYTEKYIQLLLDIKLIKRCFIVFELGKNKKYHVHILLSTNPNTINIEETTERCWLIGNSITIPITETKNMWSYVTKEIKKISNKKTDELLVDNWFFKGDFKKETIKNKEKKYDFSTIELKKIKSNSWC